jgi:hypothetical protein
MLRKDMSIAVFGVVDLVLGNAHAVHGSSLSDRSLIGLCKHLAAVCAHYPNFLGGADDGAALGAYPAACAALCLGGLVIAAIFGGCGLWCTCSCKVCPAQPLNHLDVLPALEDDEVQQLFGGACDCPAVLVVVVDVQAVGLGGGLKVLVVVHTLIATSR